MRAIYAFSGDPITFGHLDIVRRAAKTYDSVMVAIGENPQKKGDYLFTRKQRLELTQNCLKIFKNVSCVNFSGLLGEYAYRNGFDVIIRGVRTNSDLENELVQFAVNGTLHPSVDTVFFPTRPELSHISSGVVKAIVAEGGDVSKYCPLSIKEALEKKILKKFTVGIAGGIGSGKSYISRLLIREIGKKTKASYVSLDSIGHYILESSDGLVYQNTRQQIAKNFGPSVLLTKGTIDRKALGRKVFADPKALSELDKIMHEPIMARLYEETRELHGGVILIEGAILVEAKWTNLVNNNVILVDAPSELRLERISRNLGISTEEGLQKIKRQISNSERTLIMKNRIKKNSWGRIWEVQNDKNRLNMKKIVDEIVALATFDC